MTKNSLLVLTASLLVIFVTVCFGFDDATLDDNTRRELDKTVAQLDSFSVYRIQVSGHTDNIGSLEYNRQLSQKRANAVKNYLISKHVDSTNIELVYYGETQPAVPNTTEENRALNRRVEVTITGEKKLQIAEEIPAPEPETNAESIQQKPLKEEKITVVKTEIRKKKKPRRRLVWTGWRTGFHWSTAGG